MSIEEKNISQLIKENLEKAQRIISDKSRAESIIFSALQEISKLLDNKVDFINDEIIDNDGDLIIRVRVRNKKTEYSHFLFSYYFHVEKIFPMMVNYQNILAERCNNIDEVYSFVEKLLSNESFMIKIILASESDGVFDTDVPF